MALLASFNKQPEYGAPQASASYPYVIVSRFGFERSSDRVRACCSVSQKYYCRLLIEVSHQTNCRVQEAQGVFFECE